MEEEAEKEKHKAKRQKDCLTPMCIQEKLASHIHRWSDKELEYVTLLFDGGVDGTPQISAPAGVKWTSLRINDGDLYGADTLNDSKGLIYLVSDGVSPFMQLPRKATHSMTKMDYIKENKRFCTTLHCTALSITRSKAPFKVWEKKTCIHRWQVCRQVWLHWCSGELWFEGSEG